MGRQELFGISHSVGPWSDLRPDQLRSTLHRQGGTGRMGSKSRTSGVVEGIRSRHRTVRHTAWTEQIPDEEWAIYQSAIEVLRSTGKRFMLAGAFSLACYTGRWRNTKDLDFYVLPQDRGPIIDALTKAGFVDYYDRLPYVRHWIYRAWKNDCIVDIIWAMANQRAQVDEEWFDYAPEICVRGEKLKVVPAEELLWCKLYVMQKDRCDWPDVISLIHSVGDDMDWEHLLSRLGDDRPLLAGLLHIYCWLCPGMKLSLPPALGGNLPGCETDGPHVDQCRIDFLDTRPWFIAAKNTS
jgi:hypothetical protein